MRKTFSVALLAFSIAMITANSLAKRVHRFLRPQAEEEKIETTFFPFALTSSTETNYIKVHDIDEVENTATEEPYVIDLQYPAEENLPPVREFIPPVMKTGLTDEEKQTVRNYAKNDKLKAFITEISSVVSQDDLKQENYLKIAFNPQVRSIFEKYARDKEFREIATNVMKDKEVLEFAKKIIQDKEVRK